MKRLFISTHPLQNFLEDHGCSYVNPSGVEICLQTDNSVSISSNYPGYDLDECKLVNVFPNTVAFNRLFPGRQSKALESVTEAKCLQLFMLGQVSLWCMADPYYGEALVFQLRQDGLFAMDEDAGYEWKVTAGLVIPPDFIDYTKEYFKNKDGASLTGLTSD